MRCARCSLEIQSHSTFTVEMANQSGHHYLGNYCAGCMIAMIGASNLSRLTRSLQRIAQLPCPWDEASSSRF